MGVKMGLRWPQSVPIGGTEINLKWAYKNGPERNLKTA